MTAERAEPAPCPSPDEHPASCGNCAGKGVALGPDLVFRDVEGRGMPTSSYVYCGCKCGEALRQTHCVSASKRASLIVARRLDCGSMPGSRWRS
jgi:hypothetical protein